MSHKFFNINYEFDRERVLGTIDRHVAERKPGYICVADGVILDMTHRDPEYLKIINSSIFSICDSSYVPIYIRTIHGHRFKQYAGSEIFRDIISGRRHRMIFLGTRRATLDGLQKNLVAWNPDVAGMTFTELPFCNVEDFDYPAIARMIADDGADIIWIALGAPKQEQFMHRLLPHLEHGVMIAVGAAFKFFSGTDERRAPDWMVRHHMEWMHRITQEPGKQLRRCSRILRTLPSILLAELKEKK